MINAVYAGEQDMFGSKCAGSNSGWIVRSFPFLELVTPENWIGRVKLSEVDDSAFHDDDDEILWLEVKSPLCARRGLVDAVGAVAVVLASHFRRLGWCWCGGRGSIEIASRVGELSMMPSDSHFLPFYNGRSEVDEVSLLSRLSHDRLRFEGTRKYLRCRVPNTCTHIRFENHYQCTRTCVVYNM